MNWNSSRESNVEFLEFKFVGVLMIGRGHQDLKENQKTIIKIKTKVQSGSFENPKNCT
jgi:hypothetical protein